MSSYKYEIYYPKSYQPEPGKPWPLLLFLHGAGEKGDNLEVLKRQGLPKLLATRQDFPFVVAYPQCPRHAYWRNDLLNEWLDEVLAKVNADTNRVYLTGISMGGYGTWNWAAANPEKFAAIIPICGGGDLNKAIRLVHMPIWAFHGAKDDVVPLTETTDMVAGIRALGGNVELTLYPHLKHDSWTDTYNNPVIYDWLLQHKRNARA